MSATAWIGAILIAVPLLAVIIGVTFMVWEQGGWRGAAIYWGLMIGLLAPILAGAALLETGTPG